MASLDDILKDVTDQGTAIGSIKTLVQGLHGQVMDLLAGTVLPAAVQQKVDAIFTNAQANSAALADALAAGVTAPAPVVAPTATVTPPAPAPTPDPTVTSAPTVTTTPDPTVASPPPAASTGAST